MASAKQHLAEILSGARLYRTITDPLEHPHQEEGINQLLMAIGYTRMESSVPFVLSVLQAHELGTFTTGQVRAILREMLVLLVRRKMTELPTKQYDVMFPPLLSKIVNEVNPIRALHEQFKKHSMWVSDQEFSEALCNKPCYRRSDLAFSRLLLVEIDKKFQDYGQLPDYSTVSTIEHTIPQSLDQAWKTYLGPDATDIFRAPSTPSVICVF